MDGRRHRLDPEEAVDHAQDRLELLAALEPDHEVGLQHVDLVVLHELATDPGDLAARVHDQQLRALVARSVAKATERAHQRDQVILRRDRADEPQGVGLGHPLGDQVVGFADVLHAHRRGRTHRLLGHVRIDVGDPSADPQRESGGRSGEGALAGVEPAEEQDRAGMPRCLIDELLVLVHRGSSVRSRRSRL